MGIFISIDNCSGACLLNLSIAFSKISHLMIDALRVS